jgi:hypothetical protein
MLAFQSIETAADSFPSIIPGCGARKRPNVGSARKHVRFAGPGAGRLCCDQPASLHLSSITARHRYLPGPHFGEAFDVGGNAFPDLQQKGTSLLRAHMILSLGQALGLEFIMISTALALMLVTAAQASDPTNVQRRSYNICLNQFMRSKLRDRLSPEEFDTAVEGACAEQEAALKNAIIQRNVGFGDSRAAAERDAGMEIDDYQGNAREMYREHKENNTLPE